MAALKSQGSTFKVATAAGSPKTLTGITQAAPGVASSTSHGLANGTVVVVTTVVGMVEVNDGAFVVKNTATNAFDLSAEDTTLFTAYASGGIATPQTMTEIGTVMGVPTLFDGEANDIDGTHLKSRAEEVSMGIQRFGSVQMNLLLYQGDAGQARLRYLKKNQLLGTFSVTLSDGTISAFRGYVKSFALNDVTPDGNVKATVNIRVTGEPSWLA